MANWASTTLGTHLRVEHWANANDGGLAAGRSMAGADVTYDPIPFFFSDQYDTGLEYAGYVPRGSGEEVVLRGEPSTNEFMAFWVVADGDGVRVLAGMHVNVWDTIDAVQQLVRDRTVVDRDRLASTTIPLGGWRPPPARRARSEGARRGVALLRWSSPQARSWLAISPRMPRIPA